MAQLNVTLPTDLLAQVRAAAAATDIEGRGGALSRFVQDALERRVRSLLRKRKGVPFPPAPKIMPKGRARKS